MLQKCGVLARTQEASRKGGFLEESSEYRGLQIFARFRLAIEQA